MGYKKNYFSSFLLVTTIMLSFSCPNQINNLIENNVVNEQKVDKYEK